MHRLLPHFDIHQYTVFDASNATMFHAYACSRVCIKLRGPKKDSQYYDFDHI